MLERKPEYDEEHGPKRLAVLFLFTHGIATYDALFCQARNKLEPFAILLHAQIKPTYLLAIKVNSYLNTKFLEQMAVPMDS
jgi:hypothetical protein